MAELNWTEVDGVTTMWAEASVPFRAGLLFRTGRADEPLAKAGQTHLIEHMALSMIHDPAHPHNGFVGPAIAGFITMGQPQDVSNFLTKVCEALGSLPGDRLESEKKVLAAENATRLYDVRSTLLMRRYGAAGYGQMGIRELGLSRATLEQLREYSAQQFTRENAVLWLSGPPPADLRLRLPHGTKQPLPPLVSIQKKFPSWFVDNACGGVAVGATVPRVAASTVFSLIASKRFHKRLRTDWALSYSPLVVYDHLNAEIAHLVLYADSDQDHRVALASAFGEVFEGFDTIDDAEVETAKEQIHERWRGALAPPVAEQIVADVQRVAVDWLFGKEYESMESLVTEMLAITASDVADFVREVRASAMFAVPANAKRQAWAGTQAPVSTAPAVKGKEIISLDAPIVRERLIHGLEGVSALLPDGVHFTVRYSDLAAALYYQDGGVQLIGADAAMVTIEPTLWRDGHRVCREIREQVPPHLLLDQGSRPADAIPKPRTTAWQRLRSRLSGS